MQANLPSFFSFYSAADLIRIGKYNDGGYLVSQSDIDNSDVLIGCGICDDWSFESDFVKINDVEVYAYDASVNVKFWLKRILIESIKNPFSFYAIKKIISYRNFFKGKHKHIKKFVGLNVNSQIHCTLTSALECADKDNIFLKIDVEGSEYRFLDELIQNQNRISGLVLELHDCDVHLSKIEKFIKNFGLNLVHIHANNYAYIRLDDGLPLVLELTFSKHGKLLDKTDLPHKLDMPNNKNEAEIELIVGN